jgi:hypothetical protein
VLQYSLRSIYTLILHQNDFRWKSLMILEYCFAKPFLINQRLIFDATFNNILVISWRSVLLVEEIGVPGENQRPVASH